MAKGSVLGWEMEWDRGPDWLFVKLRGSAKTECVTAEVANSVLKSLDQQFTHRVVVEMDEILQLRPGLVNELKRLHQMIKSTGGMMRLAGVSNANQEVLRRNRLEKYFPQYPSRTDAVMGYLKSPACYD